jgi:hypothetical protein
MGKVTGKEQEMSDCQIEINIDSAPGFSDTTNPKARKEHKCCECGRVIKVGEIYNRIAGVWESEFRTYKTCRDCESIRSTFFSSWTFTEVIEDLQEYIGEYDKEKLDECIQDLTPAAKNRVLEMYEERTGK